MSNLVRNEYWHKHCAKLRFLFFSNGPKVRPNAKKQSTFLHRTIVKFRNRLNLRVYVGIVIEIGHNCKDFSKNYRFFDFEF